MCFVVFVCLCLNVLCCVCLVVCCVCLLVLFVSLVGFNMDSMWIQFVLNGFNGFDAEPIWNHSGVNLDAI